MVGIPNNRNSPINLSLVIKIENIQLYKKAIINDNGLVMS